MDRELAQDFTRRVTQASRTELVVITYEIILEDFRSAKTAFEKKDRELYEKELKHALRFLNELIGALDFSIAAASVIETLRRAFKEISLLDHSGPVMQNTQQLYAGLTYGKGTLNEAYIDPNEVNRGFLA